MKKIKVFYLITSLGTGGAEIMLKNIILKLNKERFDISVCSLINLTDIVDLIKPNVKQINILNFYKFLSFLPQLFKLRRIFKKENPDILHCFLPHANIISRFIAIGCRSKVICSIRGKFTGKNYLNVLDKLTQILVDKYLINSKSLIDFAISYGITEKKIILIENGIDFDRFKNKQDPDDLRSELNLPDFPIITMIAKSRRGKDYPTILHALSILQKEFDFSFLSVGSGTKFEDETQKIKKLIKDLNLKNVKLLGLRKDIPDILALTDIWVSSTLFEGQSNSLLEAMAMKKPIVTTNIPGNSEVVRDGKEAILVPVKSPKLLAESIKQLIQNKNLAEILAENAYKKVYKEYNLINTIKILEKLYHIVLS